MRCIYICMYIYIYTYTMNPDNVKALFYSTLSGQIYRIASSGLQEYFKEAILQDEALTYGHEVWVLTKRIKSFSEAR